MELRISEAQRIEVIKQIVGNPIFLGDYRDEEGGILTFLEMIWDLRSMPSEDKRYTNARDDIWKHIVVNDDITIEELFLDRLPSSHSDQNKFVELINSTVHPSVIRTETDRDEMIIFISTIVAKYGHKLIITDYFGEIPVYTLTDNANITELNSKVKQGYFFFLAIDL